MQDENDTIREKDAMKEMFTPYIEMLSNKRLKTLIWFMLDDIPEYFWYKPASSSGKYHPMCDLGVGGLVRHTIMVTQCALDLCRMESEEMEKPCFTLDVVIVACLFHDAFKYGTDREGIKHTTFIHPILAGNFAYKQLRHYDISFAEIVSGAIGRHMGRWNKDRMNEFPDLDLPENEYDRIVHTADYMASRKYIQFISE